MLQAEFINKNLLSAEIGNLVNLEAEPVNMTAERTADGVRVTISDVRGTTEAVILDGPKGDKGERGDVGIQGEVGPQGPQGEQGIQGEVGPQGPQGIQGEVGPIGPAGPVGARGIQGPQGEKGEQGIQGIQGIQGEQGPKGDRGDTGPQGPKGDKGDKGDVGPQGPQGDRGPQGPAGTGSGDMMASVYDPIGGARQVAFNDELENYVKATDWANGSRGGVFVTSGSYAITVSANGYLQTIAKTYAQYESMDGRGFIGKGTLENVLDGKGYITADDVPPALFWCEYGVTTYAEITEALDNGMLPVCVRSNRIYRYSTASSSSGYHFSVIASTTIYRLTCGLDSTWENKSYELVEDSELDEVIVVDGTKTSNTKLEIKTAVTPTYVYEKHEIDAMIGDLESLLASL